MDTGQCSGSKVESQPWAKLVPRDVRHQEIEICSVEEVISSPITDSSPEVLAWCAITRDGDDSFSIRNTSSTAIIVDGNLVLHQASLKDGSEIVPGPVGDGYMSYTFQVVHNIMLDLQSLKISLDVEHAKCSICLNIWHDVVTVSPCLHNFCNGCFSEWLRKSSTKTRGGDQSIVCPQCRAGLHSVGRNYFLRNIEKAILQTFSSLKRSDEEIALAETQASITSNLELNLKVSDAARPLFTCNVMIVAGGCHLGLIWVSHNTAWDVIGLFCGAYWPSQGLDSNEYGIICSPQSFKRISERSISIIPVSVHQNNPYERDVTERCIKGTGKALPVVISELLTKFYNKEIDLASLRINHAEFITAETHLCSDCYEKLVDYLLYWFRITLPRHFYPPDAAARDNCWYGYGCRTQHHNSDHAKKRNHLTWGSASTLDVEAMSGGIRFKQIAESDGDRKQ
ncbi:hypothetical protein HPP92_016136 [Vanilla planifolia]|uniref:RING-type domain-containing protein n=1 Tax=Vanilla planifolia TaxID=51239 RepID=A0A835URV3_VANPL|nr:hypothetical protein HPP92_016136 [Vanilla planifolia]